MASLAPSRSPTCDGSLPASCRRGTSCLPTDLSSSGSSTRAYHELTCYGEGCLQFPCDGRPRQGHEGSPLRGGSLHPRQRDGGGTVRPPESLRRHSSRLRRRRLDSVRRVHRLPREVGLPAPRSRQREPRGHARRRDRRQRRQPRRVHRARGRALQEAAPEPRDGGADRRDADEPRRGSRPPAIAHRGIGREPRCRRRPPKVASSGGRPSAVVGGEIDTSEQRYEKLASIGSGGMGTVYRARQVALNREVALKEVRDLFGFFSEDQRNEIVRRFTDVVRAWGNLAHPNILPIHDVNMWVGVSVPRHRARAERLGAAPDQRRGRDSRRAVRSSTCCRRCTRFAPRTRRRSITAASSPSSC